MALITYDNKVALNENPSIADINKVKAGDMNEIKSVVNENETNRQAMIVNTKSSSTTNAYSCDYSNKAFMGTILWTNSSPTSSIGDGTNIVLSSSDYDFYEIIYKTTTTSSALCSAKSIKGYGTYLHLNIYGGEGRSANGRSITYTDATHLTTGPCYGFSRSQDFVNNNYCIPLYVIGYKTGLI